MLLTCGNKCMGVLKGVTEIMTLRIDNCDQWLVHQNGDSSRTKGGTYVVDIASKRPYFSLSNDIT